jgi:serine/threonine protein kinase
MPGSSKRAQTTRDGRGTEGYRAPELIQDEKGTYTNKVDIWAIGCILHEVWFLQKAFGRDWEVISYSRSGERISTAATSQFEVDEGVTEFISKALQALLDPEPLK